jgi:hypothetical protein
MIASDFCPILTRGTIEVELKLCVSDGFPLCRVPIAGELRIDGSSPWAAKGRATRGIEVDTSRRTLEGSNQMDHLNPDQLHPLQPDTD